MLRLLYLLTILLAFAQCRAQVSVLDSIKEAIKLESKFFVGFHNRNTFVNTNTVKLYGIIAGNDYQGKLKIYAGYYGLHDAATKRLIKDSRFSADTVMRILSINNFSAGIEHRVYSLNKLNVMVPIQIGVGSMNFKYVSSDSTLLKEYATIVPLESGVNAYYNITNWLVLKSGVGYRLCLGNKEALKLSSPYYNIGLAIKVGEVVRSIKGLMD